MGNDTSTPQKIHRSSLEHRRISSPAKAVVHQSNLQTSNELDDGNDEQVVGEIKGALSTSVGQTDDGDSRQQQQQQQEEEEDEGEQETKDGCQCMACQVKLCSLYRWDEDTIYAVHEHPAFSGIPVCGRCSLLSLEAEKEILKMELNQKHDDGNNVGNSSIAQRDQEEEEEEDTCRCSLCALSEDERSDDSVLFLCDGCPRGVCRKCLLRVYETRFSKEDSEKAVQALVESNEEWKCFRCDFAFNGLNLMPENVDEDDFQDVEAFDGMLLNKLTRYEDSKAQASYLLEAGQLKIQQELIIKECDCEEEALEEFENYKQLWRDHYERIEADIPVLHERIDANLLRGFYKEYAPPIEYAPREMTQDEIQAAECIVKENVVKEYVHDEKLCEMELEDLIEGEGEIIDLGNELDVKQKSSSTNVMKISEKMVQRALKAESLLLSEFSNMKVRERKERTDEKSEHKFDNDQGVACDHRFTVMEMRSQSQKAMRKLIERKRKKGGSISTLNFNKQIVARNTLSPTIKRINPDRLVQLENSVKVPLVRKRSSSPVLATVERLPFTSYDPSKIALNPTAHLNKQVFVAKAYANVLKPHQVEGIRFMFDNISMVESTDGNPSLSDSSNSIRGCILAHNMGLGKTLQSIVLLHTLLTHPRKFMKHIIVCVPVNTLTNWQNEFDRWVLRDKSVPKFYIFCINNSTRVDLRKSVVMQWKEHGGVLLLALDSFVSLVTKKSTSETSKYEQEKEDLVIKALISTEMVVLDEAHTVLKNPKSVRFKAFNKLENSARRIALTGTPLQNNLLEYYYITTFVRPDIFPSKRIFETDYIQPMLEGSCSDSTAEARKRQRQVLLRLHRKLNPFVQRKTSSLLLKDLPPMQQAVIVARSSRVQMRLQRLRGDVKNKFLEWYSGLRPVFNHPGCLLQRQSSTDAQSRSPSPSDCIVSSVYNREIGSSNKTWVETAKNQGRDDLWWTPVLKKYTNLNKIEYGAKMILLLQILAHSDDIKDKVVVFSQCLKTLDFVEGLLNQPKWNKGVLASQFSTRDYGGWTRNKDYLRIDGSNSASERGSLIRSFERTDSLIKAFLISTKAGGLGINLTSANRVVLLDSGWNPSLEQQAIYRCYRYGQTKPVYVYRLLAEGPEEKIYKRQISKIGLAARVVDKDNPERTFSAAELAEISRASTWVRCDTCDKWRMLPPEAIIDLDAEWHCRLNYLDLPRSKCSAPERDEQWYLKFKAQRDPNWNGNVKTADALVKEEERQKLRKKDEVLDKLLSDHEGPFIGRYFFHESLLATDKAEERALQEEKVESLKNKSLASPSPQKNKSRRVMNSAEIPQTKLAIDEQSSTLGTLAKIDHNRIQIDSSQFPVVEPNINESAINDKLAASESIGENSVATNSLAKGSYDYLHKPCAREDEVSYMTKPQTTAKSSQNTTAELNQNSNLLEEKTFSESKSKRDSSKKSEVEIDNLGDVEKLIQVSPQNVSSKLNDHHCTPAKGGTDGEYENNCMYTETNGQMQNHSMIPSYKDDFISDYSFLSDSLVELRIAKLHVDEYVKILSHDIKTKNDNEEIKTLQCSLTKLRYLSDAISKRCCQLKAPKKTDCVRGEKPCREDLNSKLKPDNEMSRGLPLSNKFRRKLNVPNKSNSGESSNVLKGEKSCSDICSDSQSVAVSETSIHEMSSEVVRGENGIASYDVGTTTTKFDIAQSKEVRFAAKKPFNANEQGKSEPVHQKRKRTKARARNRKKRSRNGLQFYSSSGYMGMSKSASESKESKPFIRRTGAPILADEKDEQTRGGNIPEGKVLVDLCDSD